MKIFVSRYAVFTFPTLFYVCFKHFKLKSIRCILIKQQNLLRVNSSYITSVTLIIERVHFMEVRYLSFLYGRFLSHSITEATLYRMFSSRSYSSGSIISLYRNPPQINAARSLQKIGATFEQKPCNAKNETSRVNAPKFSMRSKVQ